ncbi:sugar transferase [Leptolyngbya ohadii]|uniref:sugar transferase n=1 Tax=Leptolyngbya ohadii TaxID=1962290 RepID=UPI0019D43341|nr:sugar transferase [Leptolyngbya ohadii]
MNSHPAVSLQQRQYAAPASSLMTPRRLAIFLLVSDLFSLFFSLHLAHFLRFGYVPGTFSIALLGITAVMLIIFYIGDAYRPDLQIAGLWSPARTLICCVVGGLLLTSLSYLLQATALTYLSWRSVLLPGLAIFAIWSAVLRILAGAIAKSYARHSSCLLLGADHDTAQFEQDFAKWNPHSKLVILEDVPETAAQPADRPSNNYDQSLVGVLSDLPFWSSLSWSGIIVSPSLKLGNQEAKELMQIRFNGIPIYQLPEFYETFWQKLPSAFLRDNWLAFSKGFELVTNRTNFKLKRIIDVLAATFLLLLLSPILLITAIAIRCETPGSIFYSQLRTGQNGIPFRVYKFRSMRQDAEKGGVQWAQKRDPRVTRVGYWLRLMRIDELPQLWNVLRGDMSLIGPRPERPEFDAKLAAQIPYYNLRYLVKPGITGWAQVLYPYGASIEDAYEKLSYDLYYIKNYSLWLDLQILFKTIRVVFLGKGR